MATPEQVAQQVREAQEALRIGIAKGQAALDALQGFGQGLGDAAGVAAHAATGGVVDPFVFRFAIFVMAIFVGYYVVWSVTPALHTPLMSVTNAISSVIVVGALLSVGVSAAPALGDGPLWARVLGFVALILASVNIFGGFLVTERMLSMYKKKA
ncbi:MAG: NAD synthetase [Rhizobiales bacterium 65-9]|nr:NAD(P) transhydrogenase subunit alpha [Hyphomicrobiales bacterium]OJY35894.1 MAG: NAD synthetase [Rhizobiales bacterium 65-9]